jgi:predicted amidohydrolase
MKLIIVQKDINDKNYIDHLDNIKDSNADLVCFGELGVTGCLYDGGDPVDYTEMFETFEQYPFAVMIGFPRKIENKMHNSYLYYNKGSHHIYDKINLFEPMNEHNVYHSGDEIGLFETEFGKLGVAICYDIRFPEIFDIMKDKRADKILIPAAFPRARIRSWRELLIERARQNNLTVIGINCVGDDGTNEFGGSSMVIAPGGNIIAQADEVNETYIEVEL